MRACMTRRLIELPLSPAAVSRLTDEYAAAFEEDLAAALTQENRR